MGEMVSYRGSTEQIPGYLARPVGALPAPAVIVIGEGWGLVPHIRAVADRLAAAGFVALAPDLHRGAPPPGPDEAASAALRARIGAAAQEIAAAAEYLGGLTGCQGKIGTVGFDIGAGLALWSATRSERIVAAAGFYPTLPAAELSWDNYAGKAALIHCAEADGSSTADGVRHAVRAIEAAGGSCHTCDYPGTAHAFFNDDHPDAYHPAAAAGAWARTIELFRSRLG
ncbi:dienelactone hydrolase family protein [Micromonosporaceae bacterium DT55]|uniref:dienelactone hydrolase family protein n=1 Tax=Melissospora conviva TaxID=3388432 RepID=UPI003C151048